MANITFTEGSGLQNSIFGKSQEPLKLFIEKRGESFEQQSMLPQLFHMSGSSHWAEKFSALTAMDGFRPVGENGAYPTDGQVEGYEKVLEHTTWKDQFALSREIVDDAKIVDLRRRSAAFVAGYYRTREKFGAAVYGGGIAGQTALSFREQSFDIAGADGKCVFATDHPSKSGGAAQSNRFADAFSSDALMAVESAMQDFRGDNGEVLDLAPDTIVIPNDYTLKKAVFAAIGADKDPASANNAANYNFGRWNVVVWQYLNQYVSAGTHPWILLDRRYNEEYGGAVWLDRVKLEIRSELAGNDANLWKGYARFTAGFNDWRFAALGGIAGATQLLS